jgi:hypothetical protein
VIAAVSTIRNEADIVEASIRHLLAEGIDLILIAEGRSTDKTRDILEDLKIETGQVEWIDDAEEVHRQPYWIDLLAAKAAQRGAEWILPFDADEFFYARNRSLTVADALNACDDPRTFACSYQHLDWDTRQVNPKGMCKVAYRWSPEAQIFMGNHDVSIDGGGEGTIDLRELQYRSYEHFCRKIEERLATLDPDAERQGAGGHVTDLRGADEDQMRKAWEAMCAIPTIYDPIPSRSSVRPN